MCRNFEITKELRNIRYNQSFQLLFAPEPLTLLVFSFNILNYVLPLPTLLFQGHSYNDESSNPELSEYLNSVNNQLDPKWDWIQT